MQLEQYPQYPVDAPLAAEVEIDQPLSYREEFGLRGFRKMLAAMLILAVTVLPSLSAWQRGPAAAGDVGAFPQREFGPRADFPAGRFGRRGGMVAERQPAAAWNVLGVIWSAMVRGFVIIATTLLLMLYYPASGFKRYTLLAGPLIALLVPATIALYLRGRQEVYNVELAFVSFVAMLPGVGLYVLLTWRKAQRLGMVW
jgi:hypothetical protein